MQAAHNSAFLSLLDKLDTKTDVPLKGYSTLKVGGNARFLVTANGAHEIMELQRAAHEHGINIHVLSGGSNTLFSDQGFDGVVLRLGSSFDYIVWHDQLNMQVGAGVSFAKLAKLAIAKGWAHAAGWTGTPGLVGGAIAMNAGTRFGEIKDGIKNVTCVHEGMELTFEKSALDFSYRSTKLPAGAIITRAEFSYAKELVKPVSELQLIATEYQHKRKRTQPLINSLGSFFKNPYPHFAAQLIENCNLKGLEYKGAQISPIHANFIVNNGGAFADDILHLASHAQRVVAESTGIWLVPEIRMVGEFLPEKDNVLVSPRP